MDKILGSNETKKAKPMTIMASQQAQNAPLPVPGPSKLQSSTSHSNDTSLILELAQAMQSQFSEEVVIENGAQEPTLQRAKIRDRRWRMKIYKRCFLEMDALEFLEKALTEEQEKYKGLFENSIQQHQQGQEEEEESLGSRSSTSSVTFSITPSACCSLTPNSNNNNNAKKPKKKKNSMQSEAAKRAICVGNRMIDLGYISHVTHGHVFGEDREWGGDLFFRFHEDVMSMAVHQRKQNQQQQHERIERETPAAKQIASTPQSPEPPTSTTTTTPQNPQNTSAPSSPTSTTSPQTPKQPLTRPRRKSLGCREGQSLTCCTAAHVRTLHCNVTHMSEAVLSSCCISSSRPLMRRVLLLDVALVGMGVLVFVSSVFQEWFLHVEHERGGLDGGNCTVGMEPSSVNQPPNTPQHCQSTSTTSFSISQLRSTLASSLETIMSQLFHFAISNPASFVIHTLLFTVLARLAFQILQRWYKMADLVTMNRERLQHVALGREEQDARLLQQQGGLQYKWKRKRSPASSSNTTNGSNSTTTRKWKSGMKNVVRLLRCQPIYDQEDHEEEEASDETGSTSSSTVSSSKNRGRSGVSVISGSGSRASNVSKSSSSSTVRSRGTRTTEKMRMQLEQEELPQLTEWPHRPVLVVPNATKAPSLKVNFPSTLNSYNSNTKNTRTPCPLGKPFPFASNLFQGQALIRIKNVPSDAPLSDVQYFSQKRRTLQTVIQGKFKRPLKVHKVLTGHVFDHALKNVPPKWMIHTTSSLMKSVIPGVSMEVHGRNPHVLCTLAGSCQTMRVDMPGNEPLLTNEEMEEDCSALGGGLAKGGAAVPSWKRRRLLASRTPSALSNSNPPSSSSSSSMYVYDTELVYTFEFYQHLFHPATYHLDVGFTSVSLGPVLDGQPIQIMAKMDNDGMKGEYLWLFEVWHEQLIPDIKLQSREKKERKRRKKKRVDSGEKEKKSVSFK